MKFESILIIFITMALTFIIGFIINYYTVFGYYLPHKSQVIYMQSGDISVHSTPMFFSFDK